jgi:hypothetical protein
MRGALNMATWEEEHKRLKCQCVASDAWRCAVIRHLQSIACHCECHNYIRQRAVEPSELDDLIRFHVDGLAQYAQYISPSAQWLEERTLLALDELKQRKLKEKTTEKSL